MGAPFQGSKAQEPPSHRRLRGQRPLLGQRPRPLRRQLSSSSGRSAGTEGAPNEAVICPNPATLHRLPPPDAFYCHANPDPRVVKKQGIQSMPHAGRWLFLNVGACHTVGIAVERRSTSYTSTPKSRI